MAFVLEKISEEEKERRNYQSNISRRVIDHETGVYLLKNSQEVGGYGAGFEMHFGKNIVLMYTESKEQQRERDSINNQIKIDVFHKVTEIKIPRDLHMDPEEIKLIIKEALQEYGWGNKEYLGNVEVTIPLNCRILFTEQNKTRAENR